MNIRYLLPLVLLLAPIIGLGQPLQPPPESKPPTLAKEPTRVATPSLDQWIAEAIKNNPDIRVADAKVREAEADARRARLKVVADVTHLHAEIEAARAALLSEQKRVDRLRELHRQNAIEAAVLEAAQLNLVKAQVDLVAKETKLPYLLGRQPGAITSTIDESMRKKWLSATQDAGVSDEEHFRRAMLDITGRLPTVDEIKDYLKMPKQDRLEKWLDKLVNDDLARIHKTAGAGFDTNCMKCHNKHVGRPPAFRPDLSREWVDQYWKLHFGIGESPTTDKLRKALDAPITVNIQFATTSDAFDFLAKHLPGVNIQNRLKTKGTKVSAAFREPIPAGAFLQYLEDELDCVFILREYGVVVVGATDRRPPDAVRVLDYWKRSPPPASQEKPPPTVPKKETGASIRGVIEKVDPRDSSLVRISVGSDAGLNVGAKLEAFRLHPQPQYMGVIQILEVTPSASVGRRTWASGLGAPDVGDQVTSRLTQ